VSHDQSYIHEEY